MSQSRRHSLIESLSQTAIGFVLSMAVWEFVIKPIWGMQTSLADNLAITGIFTILSIARGYLLRRVFNHLTT